MSPRIAAGVALLALSATVRAACDPVVAVGVAYADQYMSAQVEPGTTPERFGGPLARLKLGTRCAGVRIYLEHVSSIDSTRDAGINTLNIELDLLDYWN